MEYVPTKGAGGADQLVITMAADSWWKGLKSHDVRVHANEYKYADGRPGIYIPNQYPYQVGGKYLVYAAARHGNLYANACTRTKTIELAADDIAALDALKD